MADPIITLTTDFGEGSPYVAAMKGVILGINPWARVVDLGHRVPPQDVRHAAYFLSSVLPCWGAGAIHVVVVDPEVGSDRFLLHVEVEGHRLLVPDNGVWTRIAHGQIPRVRRIVGSEFWRSPVSATFHGRDILAPVAAHLSLGLDPARLGPELESWTTLEIPEAQFNPLKRELIGEVQFVDGFGNLITNIGLQALDVLTQLPPTFDPAADRVRRSYQRHDWTSLLRVRVGDRAVSRHVRTYADAGTGEVVFLFSSDNLLEVAVPQGNAAAQLEVGVGAEVVVSWSAER